ncbi:MAG: helix-turn-helix transcriptional regulator [Candidatus Eisenbacteria bacterium]|nr:helix-turn-helix transcriptional regulator [Candidatus Eisenbacteria bacterium]MCC7142976.1 helix-turn-helix transcriptional regulator [Candidatus Eisenbacteria bacterium]
MRYPNRIRENRLRSNLTQRDVAARIGGSRGTVSAWEHGCVLPTGTHLFT